MGEATTKPHRGHTKLDREIAKELAMQLYLQGGYTQQDIADRVGKSRQTIIKWINTGKWESLRVSRMMGKDEQLANLYRQIAEINRSISERKEGKRYASPSEGDTITKLATAIKKLEDDIGLADVLSVGKRFVEFLRMAVEREKLIEISALFDAFVDSIHK